jgi:Lhr-like helicase
LSEKKQNHKVYDLLAKPVRKALTELDFFEPTAPQIKAIPPISNGENVLLISPTGSGMTEAVLLPIFSNSFSRKTSVAYQLFMLLLSERSTETWLDAYPNGQ